MSGVTCHVSDVRSILTSLFFPDKLAELVGGWSVINGAYPTSLQATMVLNVIIEIII